MMKGGPTLLPNEVPSLKSISKNPRNFSELGDLRDLCVSLSSSLNAPHRLSTHDCPHCAPF